VFQGGRWMEAENATTEQRLSGECERLDAKFGVAAAAGGGLTRDQIVTRFIAEKMSRFGVTDEELRQSVTTMVRRRYRDVFRCCDEVEIE